MGAVRVKIVVSARRLSEAPNAEITEAMQNRSKPISMPVTRYVNLGRRRFQASQRTKENISKPDMVRL